MSPYLGVLALAFFFPSADEGESRSSKTHGLRSEAPELHAVIQGQVPLLGNRVGIQSAVTTTWRLGERPRFVTYAGPRVQLSDHAWVAFHIAVDNDYAWRSPPILSVWANADLFDHHLGLFMQADWSVTEKGRIAYYGLYEGHVSLFPRNLHAGVQLEQRGYERAAGGPHIGMSYGPFRMETQFFLDPTKLTQALRQVIWLSF